jgi:hypothetical protein
MIKVTPADLLDGNTASILPEMVTTESFSMRKFSCKLGFHLHTPVLGAAGALPSNG